MPKKEVKTEGFVAFADFEFMGKKFKAGDPFVPPFNMKLDSEYDQFRKIERKGKLSRGTTFSVEVTNGKESDTKRAILPVE